MIQPLVIAPLAWLAACLLLVHDRLFQRPSALLHALISRVRTYLTQSAQRKQQTAPAPAANTPTAAAPTPEQLALAIRCRRSIFPKDMTGAAVSREHIMAMLEAANWAPTHGRTEPWRFVVLGQRGMQDMQLLTEEVFRSHLASQPGVQQDVLSQLQHDRLHRWKPVSHMIAICMARQPKPDSPPMPLWEELAAVACAVQNMHLMASALGVGGYWSSWHDLARDSPQMLAFLGLDHAQGDRCWGFFVVGAVATEVVKGYRASRGPVQDKTVWRD